MNVLITGRGTSGSWEIRGRQLGAAIGATVEPMATRSSMLDHGLIVLVKRTPDVLLRRLHESGRPIVWDVVDAWPQPAGNFWGRNQAMMWLAQNLNLIRPRACIAATEAMASDIESLGVPAMCIRHHCRPMMPHNPIRETLSRVGYDGNEHHIGTWAAEFSRACKDRGLEFVMNPSQLSDLDVVVAMRQARGYPATQWKSGVKLSNAQGSGTPCIIGKEAGYIEQASGGEVWIESPSDIGGALDMMAPHAARRAFSDVLFSAAPRLPAVAATYLDFLRSCVQKS